VQRTLGAVTVAVVLSASSWLLVACGADSEEAAPRAGTTTTFPRSATTVTTSTSATTRSPCAPFSGSADVRVDYPNKMSALVGRSVRTGGHPCYERFVVELQQAGGPTNLAFPGYWVRYATGPVMLDPRGVEVTLRGNAVLLISIGSAMRWASNDGYEGPDDVVPANVTAIREYRLTEDFEGQSTWAIGLDRARNFTVTVLDSPPRLVVDIAT
jgi:hypothetical protein